MNGSSGLGSIGSDIAKVNPDQSLTEAEERRLFEAEEGKHRRNQQKRNHIHKGMLTGFWVGISVLIILVAVWLWHILTPACLHFANLDVIQAVLVSVVGSASLTGYAKGWLSKHTD